MNVIKTSENGVVNHDTIFSFRQHGTLVSAEYSGGKIAKGHLVGNLIETKLTFAYCQVQTDGTLDYGKSLAELEIKEGKLRLIEKFEWGSRPGETGTNVFETIT